MQPKPGTRILIHGAAGGVGSFATQIAKRWGAQVIGTATGEDLVYLRSLGDGQIDFNSIFSKMAQYDYPGWAVLEWECCLKHPEAGATEGAKFIKEKIIRVTDRAFDDFAGGGADAEKNKRILGLG